MNSVEKRFVATVFDYYKKHGRRTLPWRKTKDPYRIAVSEVMLQQTQVTRVVEKYKEFLAAFPTVQDLAKAPLSEVLILWSGLGYNRRAKFLKQMAERVVLEYKGVFPKTIQELEGLPGIGAYTARAIAAFSYNQAHPFIETNIRTVFIYHFFPEAKTAVPDAAIFSHIVNTLDAVNPREWYWALMDYGSFLKAQGVKVHQKSAQYVKQSAFKGSVRMVRGVILRELKEGKKTKRALQKAIGETEHFSRALESLLSEEIIQKEKMYYFLAR